jgi:hypothetical protein
MDQTRALATPLAELGAQARSYLEQSKAANTRRHHARHSAAQARVVAPVSGSR